jgi:hypothetical protein
MTQSFNQFWWLFHGFGGTRKPDTTGTGCRALCSRGGLALRALRPPCRGSQSEGWSFALIVVVSGQLKPDTTGLYFGFFTDLSTAIQA